MGIHVPSTPASSDNAVTETSALTMPSKRVFVSYNRHDVRVAQRLRDELRQHDIEVWLDVDHQNPNETWRQNELQAITASDCFLALFGKYGVGDEQRHEINYAISLKEKRRIGFIPILIRRYDEASPDEYADYVKANYSYHDLRRGLRPEQILTLAAIVKQELVPTDPPSRHRAAARHNPARRILTVCGGSGSGTSALSRLIAQRLALHLGSDACQIVPMSRYYRGNKQTRSVEFTNSYGSANFDDPDLIDFDQLAADAERLRKGLEIRAQDYNKQKHAADGYDVIAAPSHFVVLEGMYLLQNERIRDISDATVYLDVEGELRLARRVWKDVTHFNMDVREVINYYFRAVKPAFERWVYPYRRKARLPLPVQASGPLELDEQLDAAANRIVDFLRRKQLIREELS